MVVHSFPTAKLAVLLLRHINKPISNSIQSYAKRHSYFRKYICMPPAKFYNWCEVKSKMWAMTNTTFVTVPPLNDAMAIDIGASILGEALIFVLASTLIYREFTRQARKEEKKEKARLMEIATLHNKIQELERELKMQEHHITTLYNIINKSEKKKPPTSWVSFFWPNSETEDEPICSECCSQPDLFPIPRVSAASPFSSLICTSKYQQEEKNDYKSRFTYLDDSKNLSLTDPNSFIILQPVQFPSSPEVYICTFEHLISILFSYFTFESAHETRLFQSRNNIIHKVEETVSGKKCFDELPVASRKLLASSKLAQYFTWQDTECFSDDVNGHNYVYFL